MIKTSTVERYLLRYSEPGVVELAESGSSGRVRPYSSAVVVPVYDEELSCMDRLMSKVHESGRAEPRLVVAVVNAPSNAPQARCEQNRRWISHHLARAPRRRSWGPGALLLSEIWADQGPAGEATDLLLLDASEGAVPFGERDGVGRARKWGMDCALALHQAGALHGSMLGSSDADAQLPGDYFVRLEEKSAETAIAGLLFPFSHETHPDPHLNSGMAQIEASFRYYVLSLGASGSPYAYHSIGSSLAVSLPHYAAVRGVPLRQAGEDFYLLSKLSQIGELENVHESTIALRARCSDRVPFGTGPRLMRWVDQQSHDGALLLTYNPQVFSSLGELQARLLRATSAGNRSLLDGASWIDEEARQIFEGIEGTLAQCPSSGHRVRRLFEQFDALSTLRWVRRITEERFPLVPLDDALKQAGLVHDPSSPFDPQWANRQLMRFEEKMPLRVGLAALLRSVDYGR